MHGLPRADSDGQLHCRLLHPEVGRHEIPSAVHARVPPSVVVQISEDRLGRAAHSRETQCSRGLSVETRAAPSQGVVPSPERFSWVRSLWEAPMVDLFATRWNHNLPIFVSPVPDPLAWNVDALSISWDGLIGYAFPPTVLVPKVITKVRNSKAVVIMIAPFRWERVWTTELLALATHPPVPLPYRRNLLKQPREMLFHPCPDRLQLHAWRLCAQQSQSDISRMRQWRRSLRRGAPRH